MQLDPIRPKLKAPGTKRLKLKSDELLSNFAFKFNLRRYTEVPVLPLPQQPDHLRSVRGGRGRAVQLETS